MKCLIVDNDRLSRASLENICGKIDGVRAVSVENARDANRLLNTLDFDLIFLDIELSEDSGFGSLRFSKRMPPIIFTSANREYGFDAFQHEAVDYLPKPLTLQRVLKAIIKVNALSALSSTNTVQPVGDQGVFIRVDGRHVKLEYDDIYLIESMRDYVMFRTNSKRYIVHSTLKNIEERFGQNRRFLKIHRSFIINTDNITDFDERSVTLGAYSVPVSRSNRGLLQQHLNSM